MSSNFRDRNAHQCSAWLKDKDRCCQRKIADLDQNRKMCLLQTTSCVDEEVDELVGLYFCKGWHRTGGRYAVSTSERRKVFRLLFPNAPESAPRSERSSTEEPAFTSQEDVTSPETISADISTETTRMRLRPMEAAGNRRRRPRIQSQDLRMAPQVTSPAIITSSGLPRERLPPAQSPWQSGRIQAQNILPDPAPPASSFQRTFRRLTRRTKLGDSCGVCLDALGRAVLRCRDCQNNTHEECLLTWLTTPGAAQSCTFW